jgi:NAD(P)-dependent dehydrogenase (short-subunit alcohol dehydrogenase family)
MSKLHYVITGASRGIGLEMTRQALKAGHRISALVRNPGRSEKLQALSREYPETLKIHEVDVLKSASIEAFAKTLGKAEPIDVLINNAGILPEGGNSFEEIRMQALEECIAVNSIAPARVTQILFPWIKKSGSPKLINITSLMGSIADNESGHSYAYRMSKTALNMLTKTIAVDYPQLIAFVIHPGWVKTDMGGPQAPTSVDESARGILKKVAEARHEDSGRFFDFSGEELPW